MLQRFVFRSTNYVYVYHSGGSELKYMRFMGMTESAYISAKGSYKVLCFCSMDKSRDEIIDDIKEDFSYEKSDRNLDSKSVEESIACLDEFLNEVKPMLLSKFSDSEGYTVLFKKGDIQKGILYEGFIEPYMFTGYGESGLSLEYLSKVKMLGVADNETSLMVSNIPFLARGKGMTPLQDLSRQYNAKVNNCFMMKLIQSTDGDDVIFSVVGVRLDRNALCDIESKLSTNADFVLRDYSGIIYYY